MDLFETLSTKIKTILGIDDERLEENPLRFLEKLNENSDYLTELQNWLESFNYHNLDKETKLKHERRLCRFFEKKLSDCTCITDKTDICKFICNFVNKDVNKNGKLFISTLKKIIGDYPLTQEIFIKCILTFFNIIIQNKIDLILADNQENDPFSLESLIDLMINKIPQLIIIQNTNFHETQLVDILINFIKEICSISRPLQQKIKKQLRETEFLNLKESKYKFHFCKVLYSCVKHSKYIDDFWEFYADLVEIVKNKKNSISFDCDLLIYFKCFCMYIQKKPSDFSSNKENKLDSSDFIISIIKETCLDIIKYLTEEFTINDLNILNSIKIAIRTLQVLYYETYQNVQQRIIKQVIHEIQNNCFNFVKHYYSLLSDNILQSENLNQNNLKRYGKLMNNLVIINSSYFTNDIEKKIFFGNQR